MAKPAAEIRTRLETLDPTLFRQAVDAEAQVRLRAFLDGVQAYRNHPYRRDLPDPPVVATRGGTRLLDYGHGQGGPAALVVPSLVNRAYIVDLTADRSLVRYLAERGMRPFLIDWGDPGAAEADFSLDDYIAGRLDELLDETVRLTGGPVPLIGYCMGGILALPIAERRPDAVSGLALLATPWDFHRGLAAQRRLLRSMLPQMEILIEAAGNLPVDTLQTMFASLDPYGIPAKFRAFAAINPDSRKARRFVALEDWLNDGVPLVRKVARQCLRDWYTDNLPVRGRWSLDGRVVDPSRVRVQTTAFVPMRDHIVPPPSAMALAEAIPGARKRAVPAGHIGMTAGSKAATLLYRPLSQWIESVS